MDIQVTREGRERIIHIDGERVPVDRSMEGVRLKTTFWHNGKEYIIKLGNQSAAEYTFYQNLPDEDKRFFMPIVEGHIDRSNTSNSYVVQKFVEIDEPNSVWNPSP